MKEKIIKLMGEIIGSGNGIYHVDNLEAYVDKVIKHGCIISIAENDALKAFMAYYANNHESKEAFMSMAIVAPDARRFGYGRRLVEFCLTDLFFKGFKKCRTEVHHLNQAALNVLKKSGFVEYARKESFILLEKNVGVLHGTCATCANTTKPV